MSNLGKFQSEIKKMVGEAPEGNCINCQKPFTEENVFTDAGWRETRITQMCEKCFDEACDDGEA